MSVEIDQSGLPMMSQKEIDIIDELIEKNKPKICLEWGSGNSTIYFPSKHPCIKKWLSIENNGHYAKYLNDKIFDNTNIVWITNEQDYVDCVKEGGRKFDFILIDGRHRQKCLEVAHNIIKKDGFILLHDSGRTEYDLSDYKHKKLCDGEIPFEGGFAHRGLTLFYGKNCN